MKTRTAIITLLGIWAFCSACLADELHVPGEYPTIQAAIDAAIDGDTVIVADGVYTGDGNRDIFLGKDITVRSESGPENTIIDCNGSREDPHRAFKFHTTADVRPTLDGFTITNGYDGHYGGAIYAHHTDFTINNCMFTHNSGSGMGRGGAIYCDYGSPKITNCTFTANSARDGAAMYFYNASAIIDNCVIAENSFRIQGGAIYCSGSNLTITNSTIRENTPENRDYSAGGGICASGSTVTITNCSILGNSVDHAGGGIYYDSSSDEEDSLTITNSIITGNFTTSRDGSGGGIYCRGQIIITNCTLANNTSNGTGGGVHGTPEITNTILWGNSPQQIADDSDYTAFVTYSDVQGGWPGEGNIDADPCFVQPGQSGPCWVQGDYHLLPTSPCIDAAQDAAIYTDIEGTPRPFDYPDIDNNAGLPDFDMGAYEAFILPPYDRAVDHLTGVLDRQAELLTLIDEFLDMQREAYDALDELLDTRDYTDAPKGDIVSARQRVSSAIRHHEQSADAFEKGIDKLQDSLTGLTSESEPNYH
jgi:predicted outer membrane repeat protein